MLLSIQEAHHDETPNKKNAAEHRKNDTAQGGAENEQISTRLQRISPSAKETKQKGLIIAIIILGWRQVTIFIGKL